MAFNRNFRFKIRVMSQHRFNIRVYGLLINEKNEVLITDEYRSGLFFTKFPGGGLEWGEGTRECLIREFKEELSIDIVPGELFYCTDFFVASAWKATDQLISIYYLVEYPLVNELMFDSYPLPSREERELFRWLPLDQIGAHQFTFPIDQLVAEKLKKD